MRLTIALLVAFVVYPVYSTAQERPTYNIGILSDEFSPESAPLLDRMIAEIIAVVGQAATIGFSSENVLINNFDLLQARANYQALLDGDTDIIIAFGPVNNEIISAQQVHAKPTILFGAVNRDLVDVDEDRTSSGIENLTYVVTSQSFTRDLDTFKELYNFDNVGILVPASPLAVLPIETALDRYFASSTASYEIIAYNTPASLDPFVGRIDALYLAEGFGIRSEEIQQIANKLIEQRIPSFTSTSRDHVVMGFLATTQAEENFDRFFRRIALHVEAVVNGTNLSERPLFIDLNETLTINYTTSQLVGVPIRYSLIATTEFVGDVTNPLSERTYALLDIIDEALAENLQILSDRKNVELSEQDLKTAKSSYLPSLSATGTGTYVDPDLAAISSGQNPEFSTAGALTLSQALFSPVANANISIGNNLLRAQRENLNAFELDLILDVSNVYFNALIAKANVQIRNRNLEVTRRNLQVAERNFEAGQSGRGDVLRLQSESAQDMQALIESINQLQQTFYTLNQFLNHPIDREIDVEDAILEEGIFENYGYEQARDLLDDPTVRRTFEDFLVGEAVRNAPELRALDYNMDAAARSVSLNGGQRFLPTVAAQLQYNRIFDQWGAGAPTSSNLTPADNYNIGINFSIPLFDSNQRNIDRQTARIQFQQLQFNRELTSTVIERNVKNAVLDLINQVANIELSRVSEEAAVEGLELIEAAYTNGAVSIVDLLDAQNNRLQAQLASANASYNYLAASLVLERFIGHFFLLHSDEENQDFFGRFLVFQNNQSP